MPDLFLLISPNRSTPSNQSPLVAICVSILSVSEPGTSYRQNMVWCHDVTVTSRTCVGLEERRNVRRSPPSMSSRMMKCGWWSRQTPRRRMMCSCLKLLMSSASLRNSSSIASLEPLRNVCNEKNPVEYLPHIIVVMCIKLIQIKRSDVSKIHHLAHCQNVAFFTAT